MRMLGVFSDYLDKKARLSLCRRIEGHLRECPECRIYVDTLKRTVVLYRNLGDEKIPAAVSRRLFKTIRLAEFLSKNGQYRKNKTVARCGCSRGRRPTSNRRS